MSEQIIVNQSGVNRYSIRVSNRAKYMRLTVSLNEGVTVVIPKSMTRKQITQLVPEFVREKEQWIHSAIAKLQAQKSKIPGIVDCQLPQRITLNALNQSFMILYSNHPGRALRLKYVSDFCLEIQGDLSQKKLAFALLETFFKSYARDYLKRWIDEISQKFALPYNRLTIRAQKTRWGSCSAKKNINLNYRLLFIEKKLVDYILLHELVHTRHMNHSALFWQTLEALMPDARIRDKQVNKIGRNLPCWIFNAKAN